MKNTKLEIQIKLAKYKSNRNLKNYKIKIYDYGQFIQEILELFL